MKLLLVFNLILLAATSTASDLENSEMRYGPKSGYISSYNNQMYSAPAARAYTATAPASFYIQPNIYAQPTYSAPAVPATSYAQPGVSYSTVLVPSAPASTYGQPAQAYAPAKPTYHNLPSTNYPNPTHYNAAASNSYTADSYIPNRLPRATYSSQYNNKYITPDTNYSSSVAYVPVAPVYHQTSQAYGTHANISTGYNGFSTDQKTNIVHNGTVFQGPYYYMPTYERLNYGKIGSIGPKSNNGYSGQGYGGTGHYGDFFRLNSVYGGHSELGYGYGQGNLGGYAHDSYGGYGYGHGGHGENGHGGHGGNGHGGHGGNGHGGHGGHGHGGHGGHGHGGHGGHGHGGHGGHGHGGHGGRVHRGHDHSTSKIPPPTS